MIRNIGSQKKLISMAEYKKSVIVDSLQNLQDTVCRKTEYQSLRHIAHSKINNEKRKDLHNALSKMENISGQGEIELNQEEEEAIKDLLEKLSNIDSELNNAINAYTKKVFGENYQGTAFGADQ